MCYKKLKRKYSKSLENEKISSSLGNVKAFIAEGS